MDDKHYKQGCDTARLIVDLLEGNDGDYAKLERELKNPEYGALIEKLSDAGRLSDELSGFDRHDLSREVSRFRRLILHRLAVKRIRRVSVAAAAAAILMVGGWYFAVRGYTARDIVAAQRDVTLTLPDGTRVVLDKAAGNNLIARQGNIVLSMKNGILFNEKSGQGSTGENIGTLEVPKGEMFDILLEDGTRVWINATSTFRYPFEFRQKERRVWLDGEAYFEVAPDARRPFIVETREQTLNVLGTKFNLYAYRDAKSVLTTLVEGSVCVRANRDDAETMLEPGQQAQLTESGYRVEAVDAIEIAAWRKRMFIFNDNTLDMVFEKLARWYDFEYVFEDPDLADKVMMGVVPVGDDLSATLEIINATKVARIEISGNVVTIKKR